MGICCGHKSVHKGESFIREILETLECKNYTHFEYSSDLKNHFKMENLMTLEEALAFGMKYFCSAENDENNFYRYHKKLISNLIRGLFNLNKHTGKLSLKTLHFLFGGFFINEETEEDSEAIKKRINHLLESIQGYDSVEKISFGYLKEKLLIQVKLLTITINEAIYEEAKLENKEEDVLQFISELNHKIFTEYNLKQFLNTYIDKFASENPEITDDSIITQKEMYEIFEKRSAYLYTIELREEIICSSANH
jgi:hypothetical protein